MVHQVSLHPISFEQIWKLDIGLMCKTLYQNTQRLSSKKNLKEKKLLQFRVKTITISPKIYFPFLTKVVSNLI